MTSILNLVVWAIVIAVVLVAALHPQSGAIVDNPLACAGLGLIGLGFCVDARRRRLA
ncbi:MAG: hypothetical protein WD009_12985 [Phycisphaeraceae bacterium]